MQLPADSACYLCVLVCVCVCIADKYVCVCGCGGDIALNL